MRIVKEHDERKNEILDVSKKMFIEKGYDKCSINDIINEIGIAKGTFYHYFKSKEDVLNEIVERTTNIIIEKAVFVGKNTEMSAKEKFLNIFLAMRVDEKSDLGILEEIHKVDNVLLHQKSLIATVESITPILEKIVIEGNEAGEFRCEYPKEYMRIFLTSTITLMDDGIFAIPQEEQVEMFKALIAMLEIMLGLEKGEIWDIVVKFYL